MSLAAPAARPFEPASATAGWINGFIGVAIFSASLPFTRMAVLDLDPLFVTFARASLAALLGLLALRLLKAPRPAREDIGPLAIVAIGVVIGFPLFTALALREVSAAHATVFIGLLPLSTALFGVWRAGERPRPLFWLFAAGGSALVAGYALVQGGAEGSLRADALMTAAILICGLGYAEGAKLSRTLGGWQVISWALALSLPLMLPLALLTLPPDLGSAGWPAWMGLAYVSVFSMLVGFIFWYRGLAQGGIASVGQLQLLQPFLGLALAALLLGEQVGWGMAAVAAGVVACVAGAKKLGRR